MAGCYNCPADNNHNNKQTFALHSTINQVANTPSASTYTSVRDAGQQNMVHTDAKVHIIHKTYPTRAIRQVMKPYQQSQTTNNNPDTCRNSLIKENIKTMKHLFPNTNNHNDTWKADQGRQLNNNSNIDKNIMNNEIITSKTRFSSYITDLGKPSNGSAISTLTAIVPPIAQLNEEEQLLLTQLDKDIFTVSTPIDIQRLKYITTGHPNKEFISYILDGLTNGLNITSPLHSSQNFSTSVGEFVIRVFGTMKPCAAAHASW